MKFGNPEYLHLLWVVPPLIFVLIFGLRQKRNALLRFHSSVNSTHLKHHKVQAGLLLLGYLCVTFAIARPQWGAKPESVDERLDVMIALDISTSMLAEDYGTSTSDKTLQQSVMSIDENATRRLEHAKTFIFSLLDALEGDRVGLLYFAEASFVVCPLTSDTATLREFLGAITAETLTHSGTRIRNAIETAMDRLISDQNRTATGQKVLILLTDGEDHGGEAITAAQTATQKGMHIYCVGFGTPVRAVPIPLQGDAGTEGTPYKRDANGQLVLTTLDETRLQEIAGAGNGSYYHATAGVTQLSTDLARLEKQKFRVRADGAYKERFQWFVAGALILLICEVLHFILFARKLRR